MEFKDGYNQGKVYHQLGMLAQLQRQWAQAEDYYKQALAIYVEFNDRYEQADIYHNLGLVAQEQRQWPQAEDYYKHALAIKIEFNARYEQGQHLSPVGRGGRTPKTMDAGTRLFFAGVDHCARIS